MSRLLLLFLPALAAHSAWAQAPVHTPPQGALGHGLANVVLVVLVFSVLILLAYLFGGYLRRRQRASQTELQLQHLKQQEQTIELLQEQLQQLSKDHAHAMGVVSHDLKSPLHQLQGLLQVMMLEKDQLNDRQTEYLTMSKKVVDHMSEMLVNLLQMAKLGSENKQVKRRVLNLSELVGEVLSHFTFQARDKDINLVAKVPKELQAYTNDTALTQVLDNLVSNAMKFSYPNSKVVISAVSTSDHVELRVADQGQGMSAEDQKSAFQPFKKLSARPTAGEGSSGLGLNIVKSHADRLGISISIESAVGKGTTFILKIPTSGE